MAPNNGTLLPSELSNSIERRTTPPERHRDERAGFLGAIVRFDDHSSWKLERAVSKVKYQQGEPPYEGTQVFVATCIRDPRDTHSGIRDAIVKVKFQVGGTEESLASIDDSIASDRREIAASTNDARRRRFERFLGCDQELRHIATHPVKTAHHYTIDELEALRILRDTDCAHTPQLLATISDVMPAGRDKQGMVGGFVVFILMTKVPGTPITPAMMETKTLEQRDEIRAAFKTAIMEVWKRKINPHDCCAMRNLMWDEENRKCYIVDFEDYGTPNIKDVDVWWHDRCYREWEIDEVEELA